MRYYRFANVNGSYATRWRRLTEEGVQQPIDRRTRSKLGVGYSLQIHDKPDAKRRRGRKPK